MEITFEQEYLRELFYLGKTHDKKHRFQTQVIRKYINVLNLMNSLNSTEDMYRFTSLHYEKLVGDKVGREPVRVNDQYRIEFRTEIKSGERIVTVCNILELSNHYK